MVGVFVFIFLFLFSGLTLHQSLWLDEATSVLAAGRYGVGEILSKFSPADFHPPLYYIALHFWMLVGGQGETWVRLMSVMATVLTVVIVYETGAMLWNKRIGLVGAMIFGTGPLVFYYATEARMYALAMMFVALSVFSFLKFMRRGGWRWWVAWVLTMTLTAYTDYLPIFVQTIFVLVVFWPGRTKVLKKRVLLGFLTEGAIFIPWLPTLFHQLVGGASVASNAPGWWHLLGPLSLKSLGLLWVKMVIGRISFLSKVVYGVVVGVVSLVFGGFLLGAWRVKEKLGLIWLWLIVPVVIGMVVALRLAIFQYFRFLFVAPAFYLLVATGAAKVGRGAVVLVLVINMVFDGIYFFTPSFYREDWRAMTIYIKETMVPSAVALFPNAAQADGYRYYGEPAPVVDRSAWSKNKPAEVWLFRYVQEVFDPQDKTKKELGGLGYHKVEEVSFNQILVWRYERL